MVVNGSWWELVRESQWKSVEVYMVVCGIRRKNKDASEGRWKSVEAAGSIRKVWKFMEVYGRSWRCWKSVDISWKSYGSYWKFMKLVEAGGSI